MLAFTVPLLYLFSPYYDAAVLNPQAAKDLPH